VPLLRLGALGAVLFICMAAVIFYRNTERLLTSHTLEEHSQEVLNVLQLTAQRLERMDYLSRLYLTAKDRDDLNTVQGTTFQLNAGMQQLENMIWNDDQRARARNAHACIDQLTQQLEAVLLLPVSTPADKASLTRKMLECRDTISRMQVEEGILLKWRTADAQRSAYLSLIAGGVFLVVSLAVVLVLFGFLLRDARKAIEADERLNATVQTLENRAAEARLMNSLREELQLCASPEEAHRTTVRHIAEVLPGAKIALLIISESRQMVEIAATSDRETQVLDGFALNACCGLRVGRPRLRKSGASEIECAHFIGAPPSSYLCLPLTAHGDMLGVLYAGSADAEGALQIDKHLKALERVAEMASVWIAGLNLRARLEEQSIHDGLTNLYNRRFMEIALEREVRLAARSKSELSLLMLDIDHFKCFNDTFGHVAGDEVLRGIAEILHETVRQEDFACRYGGEEMLIILPGVGTEAARHRAEEIRARAGEMHLEALGEGPKRVTVSIGVSTYPYSGQTMEELVRAADRALYVAKAGGRNRVEVAESAIAV
jgi:diguanylate cyclase (GGDEF)-like protein